MMELTAVAHAGYQRHERNARRSPQDIAITGLRYLTMITTPIIIIKRAEYY